jgi:glycerol-3-phosphate dehydrogenase
VTICGGKWTTYRNMAEDCVNQAAAAGQLAQRRCRTRELRVHGYHETPAALGGLAVYGSDASAIEKLIRDDAALGRKLHGQLPYNAAEVVWAANMEMARTLDDVVSRRTRALQLNAGAAIEIAPRVAALMAAELGRDEAWQQAQVDEFTTSARVYLVHVNVEG